MARRGAAKIALHKLVSTGLLYTHLVQSYRVMQNTHFNGLQNMACTQKNSVSLTK